MRHHLVDEAKFKGALRRKPVAGQKQFERPLAPGEPWQALRAAKGRRHRKVDFRLGEHGAVAGDGERHGFGDFAATAESYAVDGGDDGLAECFQPCRQPLPAHDEVTHRDIDAKRHTGREFVDIAARRKRPLPCSGKNDRPNAVIDFNVVEERKQAIDQGIVQRVEFCRPVEGKDGYPIPGFVQDKIGHLASFSIVLMGWKVTRFCRLCIFTSRYT